MHPIIETVEKHWKSLCSTESIPAKSNFDIVDIPPNCWPSISMVEVERSPRRYKYVVFGTANVGAYGLDLTGMYLDEIDTGGNAQKYEKQFNEATDEMHPIYEADSYTKEDGNEYGFEGGCYPLLGDNGLVSHLLLVTALYRNKVPFSN